MIACAVMMCFVLFGMSPFNLNLCGSVAWLRHVMRGCGQPRWRLSLDGYDTCSVGVFQNGRAEIIPNEQGNHIIPSYIAFTEEGERLIGDAAKNQLISNPENTVRIMATCMQLQLRLSNALSSAF